MLKIEINILAQQYTKMGPVKPLKVPKIEHFLTKGFFLFHFRNKKTKETPKNREKSFLLRMYKKPQIV